MSKQCFSKRCHFCSDPGAELICIQCYRGYHRDCTRHAKHKPEDEFVCDDCRNDDDDDDYCPPGRRVTPQRTGRPPRKQSSACSSQRRIGEFSHVSPVAAPIAEASPSPSISLAEPGQPPPATSASDCISASDSINPVSEGCIAAGAEGMSNDFCEVCQSGGRLLLCEQCPRAFHVTCIERFVDVESFGSSSSEKWACPVCRHGADVLRGKPRSVMAAKNMEIRMQNALRLNKKQRNLSTRRRDAFLSKHLSDIEPFASRPALTRIQKQYDQASRFVEIGSAAQVRGRDGNLREVIIIAQNGTRYVVADQETQETAEFERADMLVLDDRPALHEQPPDFLRHARSQVLSETTKLKDYQEVGVNWLIHAHHNRGGGILADDMGLGKTLQTLTLLSYLHSSGTAVGPFLVVCPLSCAGNWAREAKRFVPHLSVAKICGSTAERNHCLDDDEIWFGVKDIVITTYETIVSAEHYFERHCWSVLVLDEAHRIKNQASRLRESIDKIECSSRVLLSGTPLQNNLQELFALLKFLWPDVLASESDVFNNAIQLPELFQRAAAPKSENASPQGAEIKDESESASKAVQVDTVLVDKIRNVLSILMIRRTKEQAVRLPPKTFHDIWLPLAPSQVSWYRSVLSVRHNASIAGRGLRALLKVVVRLRQICAHPRCMAATPADRDFLLQQLSDVPETEVNKLHDEPKMSEEVIAQSGKLVFLDKLLQQLHVQNMAFSDAWRKAFEERHVKTTDGGRKKGASAWLKSSEGVLFLDDMQPWREPGSSELNGSESLKDVAGQAKPHSLDVDAVQTPRPHKVLIFCQFHASLDLLEAYCGFRKWRCLRLDGSTSRVLRELDMRDFNSGDEDHFIYLIGTRAGGLGINLATANHVVLYEQDWNPHVDSQAIDRAHRIGQNRRVNVYRLVHEWGIEERMFHRAASKLKMEKCIISRGQADDGGAADGEALMEKSETLSSEELLMLLQHGEGAFKQFHGESVSDCSLQYLLTRQHQPCPITTKEESLPLPALSGIKEEFVQDDGEGGSHVNTSGTAEDVLPDEDGKQDVIVSENKARSAGAEQTPPPPPKPRGLRRPGSTDEDVDEDGSVKRTASGRIIRAPKQYVVQWPPDTKVLKPREVIRHFSNCFVCAEGQCKPTRKGRHAKNAKVEEEGDPTDLFCSTCPQAYHKSCLPANGQGTKKRWSCPWHQCAQCGRSASAVGGMLIHCSQCPSALCYDCFPPNFRRVYPSEKFFADLSSRGWNVSAQKMVFFKCNSCRTLEEQKKRQEMRAEDLEAQQDEKKKAALEEKRNLAATKKRLEEEEARRRMKMHLLEHERQQLARDLHCVKERVCVAAEKLWPPRFRSRWLAKCTSTQEAGELIKCMSSKRGAAQTVEKLKLALELCPNCNFPAHKVKQCPMPAEKVSSEPRNGEGSKKAQKVCPLCDLPGHIRINCPKLNEEQRTGYEKRCGDLRVLADTLDRTDPVAEPTLKEATPSAMAAAYRSVEVQVKEQLNEMLRDLGFGMFIVAEPIVEEAKAKAEAKEKAAEERRKLAAEKAAAKNEAKAKAKDKARAKAKAVASSKIMASLLKGKPKYKDQVAEGADVSSNGRKVKRAWTAKRRKADSETQNLTASKEESHQTTDVLHSDADSPGKTPKPKAKSKGAAKAKATSSGWNTIPSDMVLIKEGPAKGWTMKGKAFPSCAQIWVQKPGSKVWETKSSALKDHGDDQPLVDAIESERAALSKRLFEARAKERRRNAPVEQDVIDVAVATQSDVESAKEKQMPPKTSGIKRLRIQMPSASARTVADSEPIEVGNSQSDLEPISSLASEAPKQASSSASNSGMEMLQIKHGAAIGWTIKAMITERGQSRFHFRKPNGTRFERLPVVRQSLDLAVLAALEAEQASMGKRVDAQREDARTTSDPVALNISDGPSPSGLSRKSRQGQDLAAQAEARFLIESTSSRGRKRYLSHSLAGRGRGTSKAKARNAPSVAAPKLIEDDFDASSKKTEAQDVD